MSRAIGRQRQRSTRRSQSGSGSPSRGRGSEARLWAASLVLLGVAAGLFGVSVWLRSSPPRLAPVPVEPGEEAWGGVPTADGGSEPRASAPGPLPPGLRELGRIPWGPGLSLNGQAVSLTLHGVADPPWVVSEAYARRFERGDAPVRRQGFSGGEYLATLRADGGLDSVLVFRRPDGGSWVVPGLSFGAVRPGAEARVLGPLLPFPHQVLSSHATSDGGTRAVTAVMAVPRSPEAAFAALTQHLQRRGWIREALPGPEEGLRRIGVFRRGSEELQAAVAMGEGEAGLLFVVLSRPLPDGGTA